MQVTSLAGHKKLTLMKQTRKSHLCIKVCVEDCTGHWKRIQTEGYWRWWCNCVWQEHQLETAVCCIVKNRTWNVGNIIWALLWPQNWSGSRPFVKPFEESSCKVSGCLTKDLCQAVHNHNSSPESAFWLASLNKACSVQKSVKTNSEISKEKQNYRTL